MAFSNIFISSDVPILMRTNPGHIPGALAQENPLLLELSKERRSARPEVGQQKISGTRVCFHGESLQLRSEQARMRFTSLTYARIVAPSFTAASAATSAARFTGKGGMARRTRARDSLQAMTAPSRREASPATFENVLATNSGETCESRAPR